VHQCSHLHASAWLSDGQYDNAAASVVAPMAALHCRIGGRSAQRREGEDGRRCLPACLPAATPHHPEHALGAGASGRAAASCTKEEPGLFTRAGVSHLQGPQDHCLRVVRESLAGTRGPIRHEAAKVRWAALVLSDEVVLAWPHTCIPASHPSSPALAGCRKRLCVYLRAAAVFESALASGVVVDRYPAR